MSYLILNGMYKDDTFIPKVSELISEELKKKELKGETIILHEKDIKPCIGCFKCWIQTPGICIIDDYGREVAQKVIQSDYLIYLTPVHFGGYSAELKKALDRSICLISPFFRVYKDEIHHETRYDKYPNLLVIGVSEKANQEQEKIFTDLVERNVLNNFAPKHSARIVYHSDEKSTIIEKIEAGLNNVGDNNG
jgi:multimeric flavodoxin WrbA